MIIFLGFCFLAVTLSLANTDVGEATLGSLLYVGSMVLLDLAILAMMICVWAVENGKL